jgi:hypothetical protein
MNIDPSVAVWIALALNAGGVLMMLGAKRQQIADLLKRMQENEDCVDRLEREKLAVSDYHRENKQVHARITEHEDRRVREMVSVDGRFIRIETRMDGQERGGRR